MGVGREMGVLDGFGAGKRAVGGVAGGGTLHPVVSKKGIIAVPDGPLHSPTLEPESAHPAEQADKGTKDTSSFRTSRRDR